MFDKKNIFSLQEKLSHLRSILILLPPQPDLEIALSAIGLLLTLQQTGKQVQLGCGDYSNLQNQNIPHLKKIKSSVGAKNLIVNFKYQEKDLDKVDYDIDDKGNFSLLIKPKKGALPPDTSNINYSYSGANADLVFVIGINSLEELGKLYSEEKTFLDQADIVSLNYTSKPAPFANIDLHQRSLSGIAEMVASLVSQLELRLTEEVATLFVSRIYFDTNNLTSSSVSANTMRTLGYLMKHGGKFSSSSLFSTPPLQSVSAPVFSSAPANLDVPVSDNKELPLPPSKIPPEWKKPKIYSSSSKQKKS